MMDPYVHVDLLHTIKIRSASLAKKIVSHVLPLVVRNVSLDTIQVVMHANYALKTVSSALLDHRVWFAQKVTT